eukprot:2534927-Pyramimonas_sp.AAC.1
MESASECIGACFDAPHIMWLSTRNEDANAYARQITHAPVTMHAPVISCQPASSSGVFSRSRHSGLWSF